MPAFSGYVMQLSRAIENAEFSRFEKQIQSPKITKSLPDPDASQFTATVLNSSVAEAMKDLNPRLKVGHLSVRRFRVRPFSARLDTR